MTDAKTTESIKWLNQYCRNHPLVKDGLSVHQQLEKAIDDYLQWMKSVGYTHNTRKNYQAQLNQFLCFSKNKTISWEKLFTSNSLECFKKASGQIAVPAINGLSRYLFCQGKIPKPFAKQTKPVVLPKIYEDYLAYQQATARHISSIKRVLLAFDQYLQSHKIDLGALKIEQLDAFLAQFLAPFPIPGVPLSYRHSLIKRNFLDGAKICRWLKPNKASVWAASDCRKINSAAST